MTWEASLSSDELVRNNDEFYGFLMTIWVLAETMTDDYVEKSSPETSVLMWILFVGQK